MKMGIDRCIDSLLLEDEGIKEIMVIEADGQQAESHSDENSSVWYVLILYYVLPLIEYTAFISRLYLTPIFSVYRDASMDLSESDSDSAEKKKKPDVEDEPSCSPATPYENKSPPHYDRLSPHLRRQLNPHLNLHLSSHLSSHLSTRLNLNFIVNSRFRANVKFRARLGSSPLRQKLGVQVQP